MSELLILITVIATSALVPLAISLWNMREARQASEEMGLRLQQHLIAMDLYHKNADRRQAKWFKELGYTTRQIFEHENWRLRQHKDNSGPFDSQEGEGRVDKPEDEEI